MPETVPARPVNPTGHTATSSVDRTSAYWLVASDGGIFTLGGAPFFGSAGALPLVRPVVGMAATRDKAGYWLVAADGGVFTYGDAAFEGSAGNIRLNSPVVGMAATPDGKGYWLVAADGGIFTFGDATFEGSAEPFFYPSPIVGMTTSTDGKGYSLPTQNGGIFTFGDATFAGSLNQTPSQLPFVGMAFDTSGKGYLLTNSNGAVSAFGDATYWGSTPQVLKAPIVGITEATGNGQLVGQTTYPHGAVGNDISNFQCNAPFPPPPHQVAIVQAVGVSFGFTNPCLTAEANWAGAGLNLYMFLTYGTAGSSIDRGCQQLSSPASCNYGFNAAVDAFQKATATGIDTSVNWWLDVESYSIPGIPSWTGNVAANADLVQGAIDGLRFAGLNNVGIYASPGLWPSLVGNYQPPVPYWAADWEVNPSTTCQNIHSQFPDLPSGPVALVQYGGGPPDNTINLGPSTNFDDDFAC